MSIVKEILGGFETPATWTNRGNLILYHSGSERIYSDTIDPYMAVNISECGYGFYCFLNKEGALNHRYGDMPYISVFSLNINALMSDNRDIIFRRYTNNLTLSAINLYTGESQIVFNIGKSDYVRFYGGQVCIKTKRAIAYVCDVMSVEHNVFKSKCDNNLIELEVIRY